MRGKKNPGSSFRLATAGQTLKRKFCFQETINLYQTFSNAPRLKGEPA